MWCQKATGIMVLDRLWLNCGDLEMRWIIIVNMTFHKWWERQGLGLLADEHDFNFILFVVFISPHCYGFLSETFTTGEGKEEV